MAVVSGVTVVPNTRIVGVALTGLCGYKAVAAMGKTLERDGGKRVLRKREGGHTHKCKKQLFHTFIPQYVSAAALYHAVVAFLQIREDGPIHQLFFWLTIAVESCPITEFEL